MHCDMLSIRERKCNDFCWGVTRVVLCRLFFLVFLFAKTPLPSSKREKVIQMDGLQRGQKCLRGSDEKKGMFLGSVFSLVIGGWIKQKVFTTKRYLQPPSLRERVFFVLFHLFCGGGVVTRCDFFFFNIFVFVVVQEYAALHAGSVELLQK